MRYDASTGLSWMSVRAYDPTLGRFLSRDPLGRAPLFLAGAPYAYAGANPLSNVDPSGQYRAAGAGASAHESWAQTRHNFARIARQRGCGKTCQAKRQREAQQARLARARMVARGAKAYFSDEVTWSGPTNPAAPGEDIIQQLLDEVAASLAAVGVAISERSLLVAGISALLGEVFAVGSSVFGAVGAGVLAYKFVAFLAEWAFTFESTENDAFWLNGQSINVFWALSSVIIGTIVAALVSVLLAFTFGTVSPLTFFLVGFEAGLAIGAVAVLARLTTYVDEEEQVFGYFESGN